MKHTEERVPPKFGRATSKKKKRPTARHLHDKIAAERARLELYQKWARSDFLQEVQRSLIQGCKRRIARFQLEIDRIMENK